MSRTGTKVAAMESAAGSAGVARRASAPAKRRRIAVFSYRLPVVGEKRGGVDRVAHDLAHGLARRGHHVVVWSYDPRPEGAAYEVAPLPWRRFFQSWLGMRLTFGYVGNVIALLPEYGEVDAIIAMGDSLLLPARRRPIIRVMLGSALGEALSATTPWRFGMQIGAYAQELATALFQRGCVAISRSTTRQNPLVRRVIPIGVELEHFHPDASAKTAEPTILFVGTLGGRKRGRMLVDCFLREVRPRFPAARLIIVGPPGPAFEGVEYRTGVPMDELGALYRSAWVYATPSAYEGFGLPYVEAMASGTPVVATPNPGSREVLDEGRYGTLATDADFGAALVRLLGDEAARREQAARGVRRAQEYGMEAVIDAYERLLEELIQVDPRSELEPK